MRTNFQISSLVPSGFVAESVSVSSDSILLVARSNASIATCPLCGSASRRVHSKYARYVSDLPCSGREIRLRVLTRRFVCEVEHCRRRIFAKRFGENILPAGHTSAVLRWSARSATVGTPRGRFHGPVDEGSRSSRVISRQDPFSSGAANCTRRIFC
jgi:transposase